MIWVHIAFVFFLSKMAITQIRERSDWFAAVSILGVLLNLAAAIRAN